MTQRQRPQTIAHRALPGELLKRAIGDKRLKPIETERDEAYLKLIRQLPCIKCMVEPCGCAAHVRMQSAAHGKRGGIGKKPADRWSVPLCHHDHMAQHKIGELQFWYDLGISPLNLCNKLYEKRDSIEAMRAVIFVALAEREACSQVKGIEEVKVK